MLIVVVLTAGSDPNQHLLPVMIDDLESLSRGGLAERAYSPFIATSATTTTTTTTAKLIISGKCVNK
jgi:hypothetical protein